MLKIEDIINGRLNRLDRGNISHPFVKSLLSILPMLVGGMALLIRGYGYHFSLRFLAFSIVSCLFAQSLDLRQGSNVGILKWAFIYSLTSLLIFTQHLSTYILDSSLVSSLLSWITGIFQSYITLEDILIFLLFGCAAKAILLFNPVDVLWLSRLIYSKRSLLVYFTLIFTAYIVQATVGRRVSVALEVAQNKWRIVRRSRGRLEGFWTVARLFFQKLLEGFEELARLSESILKERGFFEGSSRNKVPMFLNREDLYAILIMLIPIWLLLQGVH